MIEEEIFFQKQLLRDEEDFDKPEIAVEYARWLISQKRYRDAKQIVFTALDEGPRFDLYELRAMSTLINLEELWPEIHKLLGQLPEKSSVDIYNNGLSKSDTNWKSVIENLKGE